MTRRLLALWAAALAGCTPTVPTPEPARPPHVASSPYYPLKVGTRWLYKSADHALEVRVVKHERVGQTACALLETTRDGVKVASEHLFAKNDGVYRLSADGKVFTRPIPLLKMPPKRGQHWSVTFEQQRPPQRGVFETGAEDVDVAIGSFHGPDVVRASRLAVTLRGEILAGEVPTVRFRYWFVWDVGIVKQVITTRERTVEYELIKFSGP